MSISLSSAHISFDKCVKQKDLNLLHTSAASLLSSCSCCCNESDFRNITLILSQLRFMGINQTPVAISALLLQIGYKKT